jgi:hypothetical protein
MYHNNYDVVNESDWKIIPNENYEKYYSKYKFKKSKDNDIRDENFEFLEDNSDHIKHRLLGLIQKDNILINWTANVGNKTLNGLTIYNSQIKPVSTSMRYVKNVLKNSCTTEISQKNVGPNKLVIIKLKLENLFEILGEGISYYEVFVNDEECEFNWLGLKSYKVTDERDINIIFSFLTERSGQIDINKLCMNIYSKNATEKPISITSIPYPMIIELDN